MREIAQGGDGWYFDNNKIEPTDEEIQNWKDQFCNFCCMGTIFDKKQEHQIPCPVCLGTGRKDHTSSFEYASHGIVISKSAVILDPDKLDFFRKISVSFRWRHPQQDGRPTPKEYTRLLQIYQIGTTVLNAMDTINT